MSVYSLTSWAVLIGSVFKTPVYIVIVGKLVEYDEPSKLMEDNIWIFILQACSWILVQLQGDLFVKIFSYQNQFQQWQLMCNTLNN